MANDDCLIKSETAQLTVDITHGLYQPLRQDDFDLVQEFFLCSTVHAVSVLGVNLARSFEIYLIDLVTKRQVNLLNVLPHALLTSTRGSHIYTITQKTSRE